MKKISLANSLVVLHNVVIGGFAALLTGIALNELVSSATPSEYPLRDQGVMLAFLTFSSTLLMLAFGAATILCLPFRERWAVGVVLQGGVAVWISSIGLWQFVPWRYGTVMQVVDPPEKVIPFVAATVISVACVAIVWRRNRIGQW